MKQIMTISAALLFLTIGKVQAQNGIEQVLKNIETNNKELQAAPVPLIFYGRRRTECRRAGAVAGFRPGKNGVCRTEDKPRFAVLATAARHENQPLNGAARSIVGASRLAAGKSGDNPRPAPDEGTGFIGCFAYFNLSRAAS